MKIRNQVLALLMILFSGLSYAQEYSPILFESSTIYWCGIDFSKAKFLGSDGFVDPDGLKNSYFKNWNTLILNEPEKYDFPDFYQKEEQRSDISVANERNTQPDVNSLVIDGSHNLIDSDIEEVISSYDIKHNEDSKLGLVYVVEYFSKPAQQASIYVVFFNMDSKEIIWQNKYYVGPAGFGFRNYWASTFYATLKESAKDYKKLEKDYSKKNK